jgi:aspartate aminotransferase
MSNCSSQLERIIRSLYSNPPVHGARVVSHILNNKSFMKEWKLNLKLMNSRIKKNRKEIYEKLRVKGTPGNWKHLIKQNGLYSALGLTGRFYWSTNQRTL